MSLYVESLESKVKALEDELAEESRRQQEHAVTCNNLFDDYISALQRNKNLSLSKDNFKKNQMKIPIYLRRYLSWKMNYLFSLNHSIRKK